MTRTSRGSGWRRGRPATPLLLTLALLALGLAGCATTGAPRSGPAPEHGNAKSATTAPHRTPSAPPVWRRTGDARPNVMVVMMDDMRADELAYLPNVRRYVQDRGLRFTNSFSPYPLCCPARTSFLLGQYSHNHHVLWHEAPYGFGAVDDHRTVATALQRSGYRTAMVGKYLNRYGVQPSKVTGRSSVHYVPAGWTDWMAGLDTVWPAGSPNHGNTYNYFDFTQNVDGVTTPHHGQYSSTVVADETRGLIGKYSRQQAPWFLWVTPVAPHIGGPVEPDDPAPYTEADGRVQTFDTPARPDWVKGRFDATITHAPGTRLHGPSEADVSDKPRNIAKYHETTPEENRRVRDIERQRAESLYAFDVEFGRIVDRLKSTGEYDDTLIMFTSDNGYYTGEHRQRQGKVKPHEPVIHVPLLVAGPHVPHGVRQAPVTTFDLTSTILDVAGAHLPATDGRSATDVIYGPDHGWSVPMLTEGLLPDVHRKVAGFGSGLSEIGVRTGRWKYVRYVNGDQELYDLLRDPLELHSLIGEPRYRRVQADLTRLWWATKDCHGATCRKPLPTAYRTSVADLRRQSVAARRAAHRYYDD